MSEKMISLTIDNVKVEVPAWKLPNRPASIFPPFAI